MIRSLALGCGGYLPEKIVTNADLAARMDTSDEWIRTRTGITERHIAADDERTSDLAVKAAAQAIAASGLSAADIDLIICATTTPDETFPATATIVQAKLGITQGAAFDVQAVCAGFVFALTVADNMLRGGSARNALVIGADCMSRLVDWNDRGTCVLFGDGAGALVLTTGEGVGTNADRGVLASKIYSDGRLHDMLYVDGGPSSSRSTGYLRMQGKEVFRHAVGNISASMVAATDAVGLSVQDVDWFLPHQANQRILDGIAKKLAIPPAKVVVTVSHQGNTSAASVPLALATAVNDGRVKPGDLLLLEAMGGGFSWGSALLRW
ncbi:MAG: beta-ketoacyl-ACP synthase III [Rhizomicrobium sp.]